MTIVDTFVIVPTYNEADNLDELLRELLDLPARFGVLVVDDNSPDGTGQKADSWATQYPGRVHVVHRPGKLGFIEFEIKHVHSSDLGFVANDRPQCFSYFSV